MFKVRLPKTVDKQFVIGKPVTVNSIKVGEIVKVEEDNGKIVAWAKITDKKAYNAFKKDLEKE